MIVERFLGLRENKQLEKDDLKELAERARNGQPIYGTPSLPFHQQAIAFGNSAYSSQILSLFFLILFLVLCIDILSDIIPWFNFVNHPFHGVDTKKYYDEARRLDGLSQE